MKFSYHQYEIKYQKCCGKDNTTIAALKCIAPKCTFSESSGGSGQREDVVRMRNRLEQRRILGQL